jgi:hypothetical protein
MNLLLSHPDVVVSSGETQKVFKGTKWDPWWRKLKKRLFYDMVIRLVVGQDLFGARNYQPRKSVPLKLQRYIDHVLYYGRFTAMIETHNLYKTEDMLYTKEEVANCRLLTKGLNGIVFTAEMFHKMYPDAVFFGLIRNGLAICEGYIRRGRTAEKTGYIYKIVAEKMLKYQAQMPNYHIVRYEDMVKHPLNFVYEIFKYAGLDVKQLSKIRLQSKRVMDATGKRDLLKGSDRQVFWYKLSDLHKHIKPDINENQIRRLSVDDKAKFLSVAGGTMEKLEYV